MDDKPSVIHSQFCRRCQKETLQEICKGISLSGSEYYGWWCLACKWWTGSGDWIKKEFLLQQGFNLDIIRITVSQIGERCAQCNSRGAERHHWAAKEWFGNEEADTWPTDYLCVTCHNAWRNKMLSIIKG